MTLSVPSDALVGMRAHDSDGRGEERISTRRLQNDVYTRLPSLTTRPPSNCLADYVPDTLLYCAVSGSRFSITLSRGTPCLLSFVDLSSPVFLARSWNVSFYRNLRENRSDIFLLLGENEVGAGYFIINNRP